MMHRRFKKGATATGENCLFRLAFVFIGFLLNFVFSSSSFAQAPSPVPDIFNPASTPADSIHQLSLFVLVITGLIFAVVFSLLVYVTTKFRHRGSSGSSEFSFASSRQYSSP
jgi:heme/copper-type cytochrome/quinol oxidase subunit 2